MNRWAVTTSVVIMTLGGLVASALTQAGNNHQAEMLLEEAKHRALVDGDLERAIALYEQIAAEHIGNRPVVAQALVQMGRCYEKLGRTEAQKAYQRVIQEFTEQQSQVAIAKKRLAGMERNNGKPGVTVRKVLSDDRWWYRSGSPSPDGRYFAMTEEKNFDLVVRDLTSGEIKQVTKDGHDDSYPHRLSYAPIWSPDSKQIAHVWFHDAYHDLRIIGADGSEPRILWNSEDPALSIVPHDWSNDGKFILGVLGAEHKPKETKKIVLVSVADGSLRILKSLEGFGRGSKISLSPEGKYVAYHRQMENNNNIFLLSTDGSGKEVALEGHSNGHDGRPVWSPDGKAIVFVHAGDSDPVGTSSLWVIQVVDSKQIGEPQFIIKAPGGIKPLGFTREGSLYYGISSSSFNSALYVASLDIKTGEFISEPSLLPSEGSNKAPSWSPDGKKLAYYSMRLSPKGTGYTAKMVIVIRSMETGEECELTPNPEIVLDNKLRWSPDGRSLLCGGEYVRGIHSIDVQTGSVTTIVDRFIEESGKRIMIRTYSPKWSPDGKTIFYIRQPLKDEWPTSIVAHDLATGKEKELYQGGSSWHWLVVSPDGKELAFVDEESTVLKVIPTKGGNARELFKLDKKAIEAEEHLDPLMWTSDGRYLLFEKGIGGYRTEHQMKVWRVTADGGKAEKLWDIKKPFGSLAWGPDFHPDGRQIAFSKGSGGSNHEGLFVIDSFLPEFTNGK